MKIETDILALKLNPSALDKMIYTAIHDKEGMLRWCSKIIIGTVPADKLYSEWLSIGNDIGICFKSQVLNMSLCNVDLLRGIKIYIANNPMQIDRTTFNEMLATMDGPSADAVIQYALFGIIRF